MSYRQYPIHVVSTTQPPGGIVGDEWFNPSTNVLYKLESINGTNVVWSTTGSMLGSIDTVKVTGGSNGQAIVTDGKGNLSFGAAGATITNDTTTNANTFYPTMTTVTTGSYTAATVSSSKLYFNPSTGTLNATIFNSLSDENAKTNIEKITNALSKLSTLGGYTYMLIDSNEPSAGLIAQQVQKVLPEAVKYNPDTKLLSLNYNAVLGLVVEAINELEKRVTGLENG